MFLLYLIYYILHDCRRRKMYCGHPHLCVCLRLSVCVLPVAACLHYYMDPDVTWRSGRRCPLVVLYWADLQLVHGLHCYGNTMEICMTDPSGNLSGPPHALRKRAACSVWRRLPSPAIKSTRLLRAPFHFVHTVGCCSTNAKC